ncbi:MAG: cupin domain-containing protein [Pirellulales bacterium]|nr:cupin domain-containing protein [Pirellulales bacterium]
MSNKPYYIIDFDQIEAVPCPCGMARRAMADVPDYPGTIHRTQISSEAKPHYHRRLTETYYFIECDENAKMQLGDELVDIRPGMCVVIPPGTVHRAVGCMTVLLFVTPKFDPKDEVIVE